MQEVSERIKRKIEEDNMNISSKQVAHLTIYNLTPDEYNYIINFIKTKTPDQKGFTAIKLLIEAYEKSKAVDNLNSYIAKLEDEVAEYKGTKDEEKPKKKYIGGK